MAMAQSANERRLRTRYRARVPLTLKSDGQEVHGQTRNISLLGVSAYSHSPLNQVQPVECLLNLSQSAPPLAVNGTVIRCEPLPQPNPDGSYEIGVFFKEFQAGGERALEKFLRQVMEQERAAVQAGYQALKERLAARRRKKRLEMAQKRRRKLKRLRRKRLLALKKRKARHRRGRPPLKKSRSKKAG